jgi:hypothetical protein
VSCKHLRFDLCRQIGVQVLGEERLALANCSCGTTLARRLCSVPDCVEHGAHEVDPDEGEFYCDLHIAALILLAQRQLQSLRRETGAR